ncbi:MAG: fasciclin domain-containing protein [Verrucomicrobiales bacterium]|nr:fasciclin domain-containing protein [Verrucomicrobiales bacterium]
MKIHSLYLVLSAGILSVSSIFAQDPVRDDDINGDIAFGKSELSAGDDLIFPIGDHSYTNAVDLILDNPKFTIFSKMLRETGLDTVLRSRDSITIFAPTDNAFEKYTEAEVAAMMKPSNRDKLNRLLGFHVLPTTLTAMMLTEEVTAQTMIKDLKVDIRTRVDDGDVVLVVGGLAKVVAADVKTKNGMIHAIDRVLFPADNKSES